MYTILLFSILLILILIYLYRKRSKWYTEYKDNLLQLNSEQIQRHLCCLEFPFEYFYGSNLAFYRAFASPTIVNVYMQTKVIVRETEKRVDDSDILLNTWIDYGLDSKEGRASIEHLNRMHDVYRQRTRNEDFVFLLCCLIVDTIRMIDLFGWRRLSDTEKQTFFVFYEEVGRRMRIDNLPVSLEHAHSIVDNYIRHDVEAQDTKAGRLLTQTVHALVAKWYLLLLLAPVTRHVLNTVLFMVGGEIFCRKIGLKPPSSVSLYAIRALVTIRRCFMHFMPPRTKIHRLSNILMQKDYQCPASKANISKVGPAKLATAIERRKNH